MNGIKIYNVDIELINYYIFLDITLKVNLNIHYILIIYLYKIVLFST